MPANEFAAAQQASEMLGEAGTEHCIDVIFDRGTRLRISTENWKPAPFALTSEARDALLAYCEDHQPNDPDRFVDEIERIIRDAQARIA